MISFKAAYNQILLYIVIGASGIHLLMENNSIIIIFMVLLFSSIAINKFKSKSLIYYTKLIIIVIIVFSLQSVKLGILYPKSFFSLFIVFSIAYLINVLLRENFSIIYVDLIYILSVVSLVFYFVGILYPQMFNHFLIIIKNLGTDPIENRNLLFFTFKDVKTTLLGYPVLRNSGFLYEAGMFACVLLPALSFNTIMQKSLYNRKNIIFILTILTTISTAAYISLVIFFIIYIAVFRGLSFKKSIAVIIIIIMGAGTFWQLEIIGEKINNQTNIALHGPSSQQHYGRIGSGLADLKDIKKNPLLGKGRNIETRFGKSDIFKLDPKARHRVNGLTDLIAAMGIPFFIFYMFFLYKSISKLCIHNNNRRYAWMIFIIPYLVMAFSQTILLRPLFLSFLFLYPFLIPQKK